jgi:tetratricopeptide (TPR) repeat protein
VSFAFSARASAWVAPSTVLRFALATTLETQGRYREAYETALQVLDDPVCGRSARWVVARLAATLGERNVAQRLRTSIEAAGDEDRLLVDLALPSELQVLAESDPAAFWQRWRTAPERCQQLPHYWLLAGYVASGEATTAEALATARGYFDRGLERAPDRVQRASLEVARCQLDWTVLADELEQEGPARSPDLLRRVEALAGRAEQIAATSLRERASTSLSGDALAVAAQCRVELGDWPRAAASFDRAAEIGAEDAMGIHVALATQFLLALELESQVAATMPVPSGFVAAREAYLAVERARRLLAASTQTVSAEVRQQVATSLLLCAACCGDGREAVPIALEWRREEADGSAGEVEIGARVAAAGGVLLDATVADDVYLARLLAALSALQEVLEQGGLEPGNGAAIVATWQAHPRVASLLASVDGARLRDGLERFAGRLGR